MVLQLFSRLRRRQRNSSKQRHVPQQPASSFEPLEGRTLYAAVPAHATTIQGDNRGEVLIKVTKVLQAATVNSNTCKIFTAGKDKKLNTADDAVVAATVTLNKSKTIITMRGNIKADTAYRVQLLSNSIKDIDGLKFDGEYNGTNLITGNGVQGGDCNFRVRPTTAALPIARFYTSYGNIDVSLYRGASASNSAAPKAVAHFLFIANQGTYDNQVITRSEPGFVVQWGGVSMSPTNGNLSSTPDNTTDTLTSEVGSNSNIRGTISYALSEGPETAGLEFFFNLGNNNFLDTQQVNPNDGRISGPFSPFGKIKNAASQAVIDAINGLHRLNFSQTSLHSLGTSDSEWPVNNTVTVTGESQSAGGTTAQVVTFLKDFVAVRRVAVLGAVSKLA